MVDIKSTIAKCVALITGIVLLGLVIASRPGPSYRAATYPHEMDLFFQMTIITFVFGIVSIIISIIGSTKNKWVELVDAGVHLLVGIWLIMYTVSSLEKSSTKYADSVSACEKAYPPTNMYNSIGSKITKEDEQIAACMIENTLPYDMCICRVRVVSKYSLTYAAYAFGIINGLVHTSVGIVALLLVKKE